MKKENLHANYSRNGKYIQLCFPIDTAMHIPVNDSVRLLDQVFERIDYTALYRSYSPTGRNPAVEPKTLFKLIVYAYSKGLYSSRKIEEACQLNLAFRWLLQDQPIPDHNTIARFRKQHLSACAEDLLTQFIQLLAELGEVQFEHLFVDGTKIEANANKYSFVWRKATEKFAVRLQDKVRKLLAEAEPDLT